MTLGKLELTRDNRWRIEAEPHIMLRFKRVFPRSEGQYGTITISNTPDVCRDLTWFIDRHPLDMTGATFEALNAGTARQVETESITQSLLDGTRKPRAFDLAVPAREYQKVSAELCLANGGLLNADDVGLGKTCSAICVLAEPSSLPALVVTLTHLPKQWAAEIARFAPRLRTHILKTGTPYDLRNIKRRRSSQLEFADETPDVIITNYHKLAGWSETLAPVIKTVIWDEVQELRHAGTGKFEAAKHIASNAQFRKGLSATPIYNYGEEIYNIVEVIRPGTLGSYDEFKIEWCENWNGKWKLKSPHIFGEYLTTSGIMLRRTAEEVGRELPKVQRIPHVIDADAEPINKVETAATELANIILTQGQRRGAAFQASEQLSNLIRQATGIAKAPHVADFVRLLVEAGERKVILYGWHREVYSIWMERLKDLNPVMYTGSETATQKEESKRRFMEDFNTHVMIISLRSGAGLDGLQHKCRTCVFGELDWSPGVHTQCIGRINRDGQKHNVLAYFLLADSGADPIMADVLGVKTTQIDGLLNVETDPLAQQLDGDHIKRLAEQYVTRKSMERESA